MSDGLDIIVVVEDAGVADLISQAIKKFYTWGKVFAFTGVEEALSFCLKKNSGIAIFIVDVFLKGASGFYFLDAVGEKFPTAHEDAIMITGNPSDDVVNMCVASNINYLLEKPIKPHPLQLAVRSITRKYIEFAKKLLKDPNLVQSVANL